MGIKRLINWVVPDKPIKYLDAWVHTGNMRLENGKIVSSQVVHIEYWHKYGNRIKPKITGR